MASSLDEEIALLKLKVGILEDEIVVAKKEGKSEAYLVASKNELVELRKKENILLEQQRTQESKLGIKFYSKYLILHLSLSLKFFSS
jgi:hypothetical protein